MGYLTHFSLELRGPDDAVEAVRAAAAKEHGINSTLGNVSDMLEDMADSWKWYEHEEELKLLSKSHPEVVFVLTGEGEDNDDVWKKFFKDGVCKTQETGRTWGPEPRFGGE